MICGLYRDLRGLGEPVLKCILVVFILLPIMPLVWWEERKYG